MAQWLVGIPTETHLSVLAMILGGVFNRVDERLRIPAHRQTKSSRSGWGG